MFPIKSRNKKPTALEKLTLDFQPSNMNRDIITTAKTILRKGKKRNVVLN